MTVAPTAINTRASLCLVLEDIQRLYHLTDDPWIEHAYAEPTYVWEHEMLLTLPPQSSIPILVVFHRVYCGCDALPLELVLHG